MKITDILKSNDCFSIHMETEDNGYLTNCDNGDVFEINKTTALIFEQCNGIMTISEIFEFLYKNFNNADFDVTEQDVLDLSAFFVENQICFIV